MKKLKTGILATIAGLLVVAAMLAVMLALVYATTDSPWYLLYGLIALPAAIGSRLLFWIADHKI